MAKKTPKPETSTIETTQTVESQANVKEDVQKAAVNVDSKNESSKAKKSAKKTNTEKKPNIFKRMAKGIKGIISELKKVTWPKGKEVGKNTAVVLVVVVLFFVILFAIDYVLGGLFNLIVNGEWATIFID